MNFDTAMKQVHANKAARDFPDAADPRTRDGVLFPAHKPKFPVRFSPDQTIFTIGSCFARNIEEALFEKKVFFPTGDFQAPPEEWIGTRLNGLLNEYNPGTISQRILFALQGRELPQDTIVQNGKLFADLMLPGNSNVSMERALERRAEISAVYSHLASSDVVIITLGFIEAWHDGHSGVFLNRSPPKSVAHKFPGRYTFKALDVFDCLPLLEKAIAALRRRKIKTIVTVSPVPLHLTFTARDCVVANEFSKSVLRICAQRLARHNLVDYFPSYEIVRSCGLAAYTEDQMHVKDDLVRKIIHYMVSLYDLDAPPAPQPIIV